MELTEDKDCELQEGDLYMVVIETSCSTTREFFGGRKLSRPAYFYILFLLLPEGTEINHKH